MKTVSNGYKNQIKEMGREIDVIISYYNHYKVITEDNYYILTEDGQKVLTEQINNDDVTLIGSEDNYGCKLIIHGTLLKTMMKEFDFEVKQDMKIGSIVDFKFGVKVDNEYEYIDYGKFIVHDKEFNEDTKTYSYIAYDYMLFTMTPFVRPDLSEWSGEFTLFDLANYICEKCDLELGVEVFPNSEREIYSEQLIPLEEAEMTFRDVLDYLTEVTGCTSFTDNNAFIISTPNSTQEALTADSFKDTNVKFNEVYGPINSIIFSRSADSDIVEIKDDESIEQNGITQIVIKDNPFLDGTDRSDYFEEMFDSLKNLTFTLNEFSSTGITYLDFLDLYNVTIDDKTYNCLLLNDEILINQGLEENVFTEGLEETTKEYRTSRLSDKDQKWANIQVKKDLGEITLEVGQLSNEVDTKVGSNEIISKINMSPEQIAIQTQKLNLTGYITASDLSGSGTTTINGSNITTGTINSANYVSNVSGTSINLTNGVIDTKNFKLSNDGSATMANITVTSGNISIPDGLNKGVEVHADTLNTHFYTTQRAGGFSCYRSNKLLARLHDGAETSVHGILQLNDSNETTRLTATGSGSITLKNADNTITAWLTGASSSSAGYLGLYNSSGTQTIILNGSTGNITCNAVNPSTENKKKNFEKFENALEVVKDTDIYKFNYKEEEDTTKKHIGFIIGDNYNYRNEITSKDNDGAELYSMISVLWQAVKEQQEEIEKLKERIDNK